MRTRHYLLIATLTAIPTQLLLAGDPTTDSPAATKTVTSDPTDPEGDFKFSLSAGYESRHIYRGADSSLGAANLWQGIDVDYKDFFHFNLYHGSGLGSKYEELTPSAYIHHDFGPVDAAFGVIWYHFPDYHSSDSVEYYLRFSHDFKNGIGTWLHVGYNQDADGYYEEFGVKYTKDITDKLSISPYTAIAFSQHYRGTGDDGLDQITVGLNAPYKITPRLTATPAVGLALPMDTFDGDKELWGAFTLSFKF
ncbi:MAG: hypothetical protein JWO82_3851 [Akkermansiaceae bacterium]|nr:hypothetical protein [Akkermansiaceae bacterium]